jgi:hypothetical protein
MSSPTHSPTPRTGPGTLLRAARELGLGSLTLYAGYQAGLRSGWLRRRTPVHSWEDLPLSTWVRPGIPADPEGYRAYRRSASTGRFFFDVSTDLAPALQGILGDRRGELLAEAEGILAGSFRLFGAAPVQLGFPPNWASFAPLGDTRSDLTVPLDRHWTEYKEANLPADVKLLWEPSRFGWVYPLARAYRLTGDRRFAEGFWVLVDSWRAANLPNAGPHWLSAQEVALRLMALVFGLCVFAPALSADQAGHLAQSIAVHANRIPATLGYARSQRNNHLLVEAVGLYTAGLLFPEFRSAENWRNHGRHWLTCALATQVFPDGGYIQHSTNYQRLALQAGLWAARLAELNGERLPAEALDALRRAAQCLEGLVDPESGKAPNLGPNDGALLLPLSTCSFEDFRPAVQAAALSLRGHRALPSGPWDEACLWLGLSLPASETALASPPPLAYPQAGLYLLRGGRSWALLRCARFTSRPGHSDQLHFDLWRRGRNVVRDAGTYLYTAAPPWDNALAAATAHNALVVDSLEPMRRAGRFLWLDWAQGRLLGRWCSAAGRLEVLAAEHNGYRRLGMVHRRTVVRAGDDLWVVIDDLLGQGSHTSRLSWLLPDAPSPRLERSQLHLDSDDLRLDLRLEAQPQTGGEIALVSGLYRAGKHLAGQAIAGAPATCGWYSPTYATKTPVLSLVCQAEARLPLRLMTWWVFDQARREDLFLRFNDVGSGSAAVNQISFEGEGLEV